MTRVVSVLGLADGGVCGQERQSMRDIAGSGQNTCVCINGIEGKEGSRKEGRENRSARKQNNAKQTHIFHQEQKHIPQGSLANTGWEGRMRSVDKNS